MSTESIDRASAPPLRIDDRGHAIAPTEDECRARSDALRTALATMATILDDPPGSDQAFMRAIDEGRPERPLFEGRY